MAINDEYLLKASQVITVAGDEKTASLELEQNSASGGGTVSGVVYDSILLGDKVAGATVKLFDQTGNPIMHTQSGVNGQYAFTDVPPGIYSIGAVKDGFLLSEFISITVIVLIPLIQPIILLKDNNQTKAIVYGTVTDSSTESPLTGVTAVLYKTEEDESLTQIASTVTISDGEYVFEDIDAGEYTIIFNKEGYFSSEPQAVQLAASASLNISIGLEEDPLAANGTINGKITTEAGIGISGAYVGLYSVTEGKAETLVASTYTNLLGNYMFGGVAAGDYIVKAKASELI